MPGIFLAFLQGNVGKNKLHSIEGRVRLNTSVCVYVYIYTVFVYIYTHTRINIFCRITDWFGLAETLKLNTLP